MKLTRYLALLCFLFAWPAMAQRIITIQGGTVTANVTDSQDFLVNLTTNVTGVTLTSTVTPATGYIVSMKFVQDATGSRTVTFGGNITTACSVNATANSVTICRWQYTASGNTWADAGGGGGITSVSSLPATCTVGVTSPVQLSVAPFGLYYCSATNTWSLVGTTGTSILASSYGVKADGVTIPDVSITNGAAVVTCPNSDCSFTAADVGKIAWVTNLTNDTSILSAPSVQVVAQTTILSFQGANQITLNANATVAGCVGNCVLVYGSDDSAGHTAAWNAAIAACGSVQLPQGISLVQSAQYNTPSARDKCVIDNGAGYGMYGVHGVGSPNTTIAPTPNFDFTTCTGAVGFSDSCFFGAPAMQVTDLAIWGSGIGALSANSNGKVGAHFNGTGSFTGQSNSYIYNVALLSWGARQVAFVGMSVTGESGALLVGVHEDGMGGVGCSLTPTTNNSIQMFNTFCAVNIQAPMKIFGPSSAVAEVWSFGGIYGFGTPNNGDTINVDGSFGGTIKFYSIGDQAPYITGTNGSQIHCHGAGAECHITDSYYANSASTGRAAFFGFTAGGKIYADNSTFLSTGSGASPAIEGGDAAGQFISLGGNTISSTNGKAVDLASLGGIFRPNPTDTYTGTLTDVLPTCTFTSGGGTSPPPCALQAGSTNLGGTIIATTGTGAPGSVGTITLTFAGALSGPTATTPSCTVSPNDSGTAWGNEAVAKISTQSTTAPIIAWSNDATAVLTALATSSPYRIDYVCVPR